MKKLYLVKHLTDRASIYQGINDVDIYPYHNEEEATDKIIELYENDYKKFVKDYESYTGKKVENEREFEDYWLENNEFFSSGYSLDDGTDYYSCALQEIEL